MTTEYDYEEYKVGDLIKGRIIVLEKCGGRDIIKGFDINRAEHGTFYIYRSGLHEQGGLEGGIHRIERLNYNTMMDTAEQMTILFGFRTNAYTRQYKWYDE